jgi:hypothetical protein
MSVPKERYKGVMIWISSRVYGSKKRSYFVYRGSHKHRFTFTKDDPESANAALLKVKNYIDERHTNSRRV